MMRLKGKVALVTGAQQGIGRAIALAFAREGADVVVNYLDDAGAAEQVAKEVRHSGVRALVAQADVAHVDQDQALVARAVRELGGVITMTRTMALELAPHGIRVNAIAPGTTDTAQPRGGNTEEEIAAMARVIPLGRIAQPDDIASVAVFLAGEESRHMTGQTLHVNGGLLMR